MASSYTTNYGIEKIGSGEQSGAWGTTTNHAADPAVAVINFGGDKSSSAGDFTIQFPANDANNAIIRIA